MNTELSTNQNEFQTKLNKVLAPDENGMVSAKHLYEMLGMDKSHFARWCNKNWVDSDLLTENVDYITVRLKGETPTGGEIEVLDYRLPLRFAIKLSMTAKCKDEVKNEILEYFLDLEEATPKAALALQERDSVIEKLISTVENLAQLTKSNTDTIKELKTEVFSHIDLLESKSEVMLTHETDWAMDMMEHVRKIAEVYTRGDTSKCIDRLIERAEEYLGEPYKNYEADYALRHNGKRGKKIFVMARDEDSRSAFEQAVKDFEIEWGIYEQNEGQKHLEKIMDGMIEEIVPDPPVPQHIMTDAELESQWADMDKMYGEGWDKQPDIPSVGELYGD